MNINELKNIFNDCELLESKIVVKSNIAEFIAFIKENYHYDLLKEIIAVDNQENGIELIYKLYSTIDDEEILVSNIVKDSTESLSSLFDSAMADEKEIFDLFGIRFTGNNELKRLYMPETWIGHPLRKDYVENDERLRWNEQN